jgi:hypothetical protein
MVSFTSGTIGEPKGSLHTFGALAVRGAEYAAAGGITRRGRGLIRQPIYGWLDKHVVLAISRRVRSLPPDVGYPRPGPATGRPLPDLALYERLIDDGIAAADARGSTVDHLTARRLAIWLAARPQEQVFAQGLGRFAETGVIGPTLKMQLRMRARSGTYADRSQAARLLEYCIGCGTDLGPISEDFGSACDQIDQADVMLTRLHHQAREGPALPGQSWPEADGPRIIALAHRNSDSQTVSLILDATIATTALFAIAAHADEREAHVRVEAEGSSARRLTLKLLNLVPVLDVRTPGLSG